MSEIIVHTDKVTQKVIGRYQKGKLLGEGGFAKCYKVTSLETGEELAVKVISKASFTKPKTIAKLKSEIKIHQSMKHERVVHFHKYFEDSTSVYIILELCPNLSLMDWQKKKRRFTEHETRYIMMQLLQGMRYLHKCNVIHRDLKLGNLFLDEQCKIKIGDFGLAAQLQYDGERKTTVCGTPNYIAPEILDASKHGHSFEVDIWALGVIMFTLLIGKPPFETTDVKQTYNKIRNLSYSFPPTVDISPEAKCLISKILQSCPENRPSLEDIENDSFFTKYEIPVECPLLYPSAPSTVKRPAEKVENAFLPTVGRKLSLPCQPTTAVRETRSGSSTSRTPAAAAPPAAAAWQSPAPFAPAPVPSSAAAKESPRQYTSSPRTDFAPTKISPKASDVRASIGRPSDLSPRLSTVSAASAAPASAPAGGIWVGEFSDFTSRYGMAYKLSNGCIGATYNDATNIVWDTVSDRIEYIPRVNKEKKAEDPIVCSSDDFPESLNKKITLIKYFQSYFKKYKGRGDAPHPIITANSAVGETCKSLSSKVNKTVLTLPFVKSFTKTNGPSGSIITFKFSNGHTQTFVE